MSSAPVSSPGPSQAPSLTFAPLPSTRRGYGIQLSSHPKGTHVAYTSGRLVVVRSLDNPVDSLLFTEHKCNVQVATFAPSGFFIASGDEEGNVIVWSYPGLKIKSQFRIGKTVLDLDWDESSTRIIACGDGAQKAKVFGWESGNNLGELTMHSQPAISCTYRKVKPFKCVTASEDLTVNLYEGPPFKYTTSYKGTSFSQQIVAIQFLNPPTSLRVCHSHQLHRFHVFRTLCIISIKRITHRLYPSFAVFYNLIVHYYCKL